MLKLGIVIAFSLAALSLFGQTDSTGTNNLRKHRTRQIVEKRIEIIAENNENEDLSLTTLFEELFYLAEHPLNLNFASKEDLMGLFILNDIQMTNILRHIEKNGKFLTIYELQAVPHMDLETIALIRPFVQVKADFDAPKIGYRELLANGKNEVYLRAISIVQDQLGYTDTSAGENKRYVGDPYKTYLRYRFKYSNNLSIGFTGEKDAGESYLHTADFQSAHIYAKNLGKIKHIALGDFQIQLGQGLNFWSGMAPRKMADVMSISRNAQTVKPYTSVDENLFLRGGATAVQVGKIQVMGFYSNKNIDANVTQDSLTNQEISISSFQTSGLHRTPGEIADRKAIGEQIIGGEILYKGTALNAGIVAVQSNWDASVNRNLSIHNQFDFNDNKNLNLGAHYNYVYRNFNFFGEVGRSSSGGMAHTNAVVAALDPRLSLAVLHRDFGRDFHALNSNPFRESSRAINEQGTYIGVEARPIRTVTISSYIDSYVFPWMRNGYKMPSGAGTDVLLQVKYKPSKKIEGYVRYKREEIPDILDQDGEQYSTRAVNSKLRLHWSYKVNDAITLKNRVELSSFADDETSTGFLAYQDISFKPIMKPFSFSARFALFDVDSYNARIYAYESDILYVFSVPAYYNKGARFYVSTRYRIARGIDLWLRFGQWYYQNTETIGSGKEQISGNTKSDVKVQLRFKF